MISGMYCELVAELRAGPVCSSSELGYLVGMLRCSLKGMTHLRPHLTLGIQKRVGPLMWPMRLLLKDSDGSGKRMDHGQGLVNNNKFNDTNMYFNFILFQSQIFCVV